ncbi:hypothetical protein EBR96_03695 [bacterium]|nr:hypothetical protein [bacterium]
MNDTLNKKLKPGLNSSGTYIGLAMAIMFTLGHVLYASVQYSLDEFEKSSLSSGVGFFQAGGETFLKSTISPDWKVGALEVGLDVNIYAPLKQNGYYPSELQTVVVRSAGYTHNDTFGIKYGRLRQITYGYGMLVDDYDTGSGGESNEFTSRKAGVKTFVAIDPIRIDGLATGGGVYGGRVSYELPAGLDLAGIPIRVGATYMTDSDGVNDRVLNSTVSRPQQSGYGFDVGLPFAGDFLTGYFEYAKLVDHGQGIGTGIRGNFFDKFSYKLEYRRLGIDFIPGYFNNTYEATSFAFRQAPTNELNGMLAAATLGAVGDPYRAGLQYEVYDGINLLTAAVGWSKIGNTTGVINYTVPFQNGGNAVIDSTVLYTTGGVFDYVVNLRRTYVTSSTFTESYAVGVRFNPFKMLTSVPF